MHVNTFLTYYKIVSCGVKKSVIYYDYNALRQHLSCHGDWWHKLVTWFAKSMFDQTPGVYEDDSSKIVPKKDGTESVTDSEQLFMDDTESDSEEMNQNVNVKG
jgi:hypothetical protein